MSMDVRGAGATKVLLLSESREAEDHYLLQRLIKRAGFQRDHFYYGSLESFSGALPHDVRVVVPMGEKPLQYVTMEPNIARWRGRVVANNDGRFTVPTYKPSALLHKRRNPFGPPDPDILRNPPRLQASFIRDLHYAIHVAKHGFQRAPVDYLLDPTIEVFERWVQGYFDQLSKDPATILSWDIETPYKKKITEEEELEEAEAATDLNTMVLRHSFSYKTHAGVTTPHDPRFYPLLKELLKAKGAKTGHNFLYFDVPVMEGHGWEVNGKLYDGMDAWHWLYPQRDKGLEAVTADTTDMLPWKHLSDAEPEWYSVSDSDAALRNILWIHDRIKKAGPEVWANYQELAVEVMDYMRAAGKRGVPLDIEKQKELAPLMDAEIGRLDTLIQTEVEEKFKPRKRYKREPEEVTAKLAEFTFRGHPVVWDAVETDENRRFEQVIVDGDVKQCSHCNSRVGNWAEHMKGRAKGTKKEPDNFNVCKAAGATAVKLPGKLVEWDEILPFNANSSTQLIAYMKAHKHPVGRNKDTGGDAADAAHLRELKGMYGDDYPLYDFALQLHDVKKARTTYMPEPDAEGLIHSTYTNTPWTWRFGSRAINMQTWGKRQEKVWARKARLQIVSKPAYRFVGADSSSAEAVIQGWFMADTQFMEIAVQSIHGWLSTKYLGWEFNPDMLDKVKKEQKAVYDGMKVAFFTLGFGGSAYGMHMANKKLFPSVKRAEQIVDSIYQLIPSLESYHWNLRGLAQKQGYIISPWGLRFDFFDVYTYDRDTHGNIRYTTNGKPKLKLGKDGKAVVALLPQHSNSMFQRGNIIRLGREGWEQYMPANLAVHDSITLHVPVAVEDRAAEALVSTMTRPIPELGGLRLGAEVEIGANWADYDKDANPEGMHSVFKQSIVLAEQRIAYMPNFAADFETAHERSTTLSRT